MNDMPMEEVVKISEVDGDVGALNNNGQEDISSNWGLQVFGTQRSSSSLVVPHLKGYSLLQNSMNNVLDALLDDSSQMALYSSEESLMASACGFWCAYFSNKADAPIVKVEWLPGFVELNRGLGCFGFQMHFSSPVDPTLDMWLPLEGNVEESLQPKSKCFQKCLQFVCVQALIESILYMCKSYVV
ncbi:uncharacterized protein [Spinacia oleracea]|uniref:Uncharacterized protein isoform X1 n=1 Tax=Spinacia oleracea TaxID=3562 RepID=A0ABM3QL52_SPIOL|nr:uncharacterized protein LOC130460688 isoform X1 [Spinacia oleracea]XP_056684083.1 uncharacterized protein LOC130460688 isoform X1 [Spinacia oleracea]XP_056684084.1 uncharacterized protein LOC130460688 isoform X1 [Spinacia oleracea]XP_056684085.1 uncharacterized protein LOC130460688 isoform X1 [Spinacia oleracea]XP_056684086.1 uncharacterized protein LOC130460688 isoform X1 [Spinacia oleracea]XP_056684087.1 uncharacterized protein LOC130460688 isoform X1 [Spinacia oleracea]XP_056684088.1 un